MKLVVAKVARLGLLVLLAMHVGGKVAAATPTFSAANLTGNWGFQLVPAKSFAAIAPGDPGGVGGAPRQDVMRVGRIHFDGATAVDGHMIATTDDKNGNTVVIDFTFSGTYTMDVSGNGTGTMSIAPLAIDDTSCTPAQAPAGTCATFEGPETYALSITRSRGLSLTQTDNVGAGAKIFLVGEALLQSVGPTNFSITSLRNGMAFRLLPATSFAANPPQTCPLTDPGNIALAGRQDLLSVGMMTFNRAGGVGGHAISTTDDNAGNTVIIDYDFAGVYSVGFDGIGTMSVTPVPLLDGQCTPLQVPPGTCNTLEGPRTFAFVAVPKRGRVYLNETDNAGGAKLFLTGQANYQ